MANCLRRIIMCVVVLTGTIAGFFASGCGGEAPPPSPDSEQYKEAKARGNEARAKEYGRRSIDDPKAAPSQPGTKGQR
jgi:hypothetical protein